MNFADTQLQACFEHNFAEAAGFSDELRQVAALIAACDWFRLLEGPHSSRVHEAIDHLLAPAFRPGLRRWYRRPGAKLEVAAVEFRDQLSQLAGEVLDKAEDLPLKPLSLWTNISATA